MLSVDGSLHIVELSDGVARLSPGVIDDRALHAFQRGQCHALSLAIHEETSWPIELVLLRRSRRDRIDWVETLSDPSRRRLALACRWVHAAVRHPNGCLLDITGFSTDVVLLDKWSSGDRDAAYLTQVSPGEVLQLAHSGSGVHADMPAARCFVTPLLESLAQVPALSGSR